jgi:hypothetical protein
MRSLIERSRARVCAEGERMSCNDELWFVLHGLLRVTGDGGGPPVWWLSTTCQTFGCLDPRCRRKHSFEASALMPSEVVAVPRQVFDKFVADRPACQAGLVSLLWERLQEERELRALMQLPSSERMLGAVLLLHRRIGGPIPMTRAEIAELTGLARETSIRTLSPYEKKGLIRTRRGVIEVLRPAELQQLFDRRLASR